ncbi:hypothetical protein BH23PLA1_BH23PLA1_32530 [soil metagenome]
MMEESDEEMMPFSTVETEVHQLMGLFDAPAFARRGLEMEHGLNRLQDRCRRARLERLDMVQLRLKQWAAVSTGPDDWSSTFVTPIADFWTLAEAEPPRWSDLPATPRRRDAVARDLIASVSRFNHRWTRYLQGLKIEPINHLIDHYNRYYLLEKECVMGSHRLAVRSFRPRDLLTVDRLLHQYPLLPLPELRR